MCESVVSLYPTFFHVTWVSSFQIVDDPRSRELAITCHLLHEYRDIVLIPSHLVYEGIVLTPDARAVIFNLPPGLPSMPICVHCDYPAQAVYTVYQSVRNTRLELCVSGLFQPSPRL